MPLAFKFLVIALLLAILGSLFSGLFFLNKDQGNTQRTVKALTLRIALSVLLFLLLIGGYFVGWLQPHGL
jgi:Protein of unknown function (DUF2909)